MTPTSSKVTSKGQVTIPQAIRDQLGIHPGSLVEFRLSGEKVVLTKSRGGGRGSQLVARMRGSATSGLSTEQIMRLTRG